MEFCAMLTRSGRAWMDIGALLVMYMPHRVPRLRQAMSGIALALCCAVPMAADLSGSLRFGDGNFSVEVRTIGESLTLSARGCNTFALSFVPEAGRDSELLLSDANGKSLGTIKAGSS